MRRKDMLMKKRREAIEKGNENDQNYMEDEIREEEAKENIRFLKEQVDKLERDSKNFNNNVWKVRDKLFPKKGESLPTAKYDKEKQLITNHEELKDLYLEHFAHRLRQRPIISELSEYKDEVEKEFESLLEVTKQVKSDEWCIEDLDKVLKTLKPKQSQDAHGIANELFLPNNIGDDLKLSLVKMCNKIKNEINIPTTLRDAFITAIPKGKKSPLELENMRGIFLVNKVKSILMKLIYNSSITKIEENLSKSNIGACKG